MKVLQNLKMMSNMSIQGNQQLSWYVFSKLIECLEQNSRKQINCKRPSNTKQMKRVRNIRIDIRNWHVRKYKYNLINLVFASFASAYFYVVQYWQIFSSFCIFCCYCTRLKACEISCEIWGTQQYFLYCTWDRTITTLYYMVIK